LQELGKEDQNMPMGKDREIRGTLSGVSNLRFTKLEVRLLGLPDGFRSTLRGSTIRGALGRSLRETSCLKPGAKCGSCPLSDQCAYFYLFETPSGPYLSSTYKYPYYPHPYLIEPPLDGISFGIVLLGRGADFYNNTLLAIEKMGQSGLGRMRFRFSPEVFSGGFLVYKQGKLMAKPLYMTIDDYIASRIRPSEKWVLSFKTPTRVIHKGRLARRFTATGVVASLIRRLELLTNLHQEPGFSLKLPPEKNLFEGLSVVEDRTYPVQHTSYSGRQKGKLRLQGFMGDVVLSGGNELLWNLLVAGEIIHAGKGTSFGFGTYKIQEV